MNTDLFDGMVKLIGCDAPKKAEGDYTGEDGLLYCGKCHTRKQRKLQVPEFFGSGERIVPVMCDCAKAEFEAEEAEKKHREDMEALGKLRRASLMDAMYEHSTFETCRKTAENKRPLSIARQYTERFSEMLEKNRGLLFYGPPGTGKTHTAACVANALLDKGVSVLMTSFVKLNAMAFSEDDDESVIHRMDRAKLLIIDDLGAERGSDFSLERVYNVIDSRIRAKLPMILTTNLSLQQMREASDTRYWRIYDRVFQICFPVEFKGPSFRQREAKAMYDEMNNIFNED